MSNYVEVEIPVSQDAEWFRCLRKKMSERGIDVKWQNGYFHITLVFIMNVPDDVFIYSILYKSLEYKVGPMLSLDKLDAFTTSSGQHVIYLTSSNPSKDFIDMVDSVREAINSSGCDYSPEFILHVTLGRVASDQYSVEELKEIIQEVEMPSFTIQLKTARHLRYPDHRVMDTWTFFQDEKSAKEAYEERVRRAFRNAFGNIQLYTDPDKFE